MDNNPGIPVVIKNVEVDSFAVLGVKNVDLILIGEPAAPFQPVTADVFKVNEIICFYYFSPPLSCNCMVIEVIS